MFDMSNSSSDQQDVLEVVNPYDLNVIGSIPLVGIVSLNGYGRISNKLTHD